MKPIFCAGLFVLIAGSLQGQVLSQLETSVKKDLDTSVRELAAIRDSIKEEKIPLAQRVSELEAELRQKRREVERIQRLRDNASVDLNRLEDNVKSRREQIDYMANLVSEYGRAFEVRLDLSESQRMKAEFQRFDDISNNSELSKSQKLEAQIGIIEAALKRVDELVGGSVFEGRAVTPAGVYEDGKFAIIGPSVYFASSQSEVAGLSLSAGSLEPSVFPLVPEMDAGIREMIETGKGLAPIDVTLGNALALKREEQTMVQHIRAGGIWMYPILGFALVSLLTAIFKAFEIYSVKMPAHGALHEILQPLNAGKDAEARARAEAIEGPAGKMLLDAVIHSDESKELVEEVMYESMIEVQPKLERFLQFIAVTAATAPLLGLLGTVTGMINTFKLITIFGTGDAKSLSGGISEALITTEFGLIVAIPALILHALLSRRAQGILANMERLAVSFVNGMNRKNG